MEVKLDLPAPERGCAAWARDTADTCRDLWLCHEIKPYKVARARGLLVYIMGEGGPGRGGGRAPTGGGGRAARSGRTS